MKRPSVSPLTSTTVTRQATRKMAMALRRLFKDTRKNILPKVIQAYSEVVNIHRKTLNDETDYILRELDLSSWVEVVDTVSSAMADTQKDAAKRALASLKIDDSALFDQVMQTAVDAANDRGASLVGMKWVDGELVQNPSVEYAISSATRSGIKDLIIESLTDGMTVDEFSTALQDAYQFSDVRATMVARTEIATAHVQGTLTAWEDSGQVNGKSWLVGTQEVCEECLGNEDDGTIDIGEMFSSGDDAPPAHPNCCCAIIAQLKDSED